MIEETTSSCLVLDSGAHQTRIGYSGEEQPRETIFTDLSLLDPNDPFRQKQYQNQMQAKRTNGASENGPCLPENLEACWNSIFQGRFLNDSTLRPIMTNHSPLTGRLEKEMKTQFFFEKIGCPHFFSVLDQLLLIYSSGKTNGFVVNFGYESASVVPILEGQPILYGQTKTNVAGKALLWKISNELQLPLYLAYQAQTQLLSNQSIQTEKIESLAEIVQQNLILPDGRTISKKDIPINPNSFLLGENPNSLINSIFSSYQKLESEQ